MASDNDAQLQNELDHALAQAHREVEEAQADVRTAAGLVPPNPKAARIADEMLARAQERLRQIEQSVSEFERVAGQRLVLEEAVDSAKRTAEAAHEVVRERGHARGMQHPLTAEAVAAAERADRDLAEAELGLLHFRANPI